MVTISGLGCRVKGSRVMRATGVIMVGCDSFHYLRS